MLVRWFSLLLLLAEYLVFCFMIPFYFASLEWKCVCVFVLLFVLFTEKKSIHNHQHNRMESVSITSAEMGMSVRSH